VRETRQEQVMAANQAFYDAFEALDLERMARVWSEEAPLSCIHPAWELIEGRVEVIASWRRIFQSTSAVRFALRDVHVYVAGDTGWVVLIEQIDTRHGEERVAASAQATNVFVREASGWRLVHHHSAPIRLPSEPVQGKTMLN
jgi:ketosteroid isomerase-like protein